MASWRNSGLHERLRAIAGREAVLHTPEDLMLYEYDGGVRKHTPEAVVCPRKHPASLGYRSWRPASECRSSRAAPVPA